MEKENDSKIVDLFPEGALNALGLMVKMMGIMESKSITGY